MSFEDYDRIVEYLPVFGEPFPVEFANSRYLHGNDVIDFLGTADLIRLWFERAPAAADRHLPSRIPGALATDLRALRDATHFLLHTLAGPSSPNDVDGRERAIRTLNRHAGRARSRPELSWKPGTPPEARTKYSGNHLEVLTAEIASSCIEFLGGREAKRVRRCSGNGCCLLFVQNHHKRRFCHESCSHRARQARYYQSTLRRTPS
jgi:predicted RNA-binding Zn ribbon-like protein